MSPRNFAFVLFAVMAALVLHLLLDHLAPQRSLRACDPAAATACQLDAASALADWLAGSFR